MHWHNAKIHVCYWFRLISFYTWMRENKNASEISFLRQHGNPNKNSYIYLFDIMLDLCAVILKCIGSATVYKFSLIKIIILCRQVAVKCSVIFVVVEVLRYIENGWIVGFIFCCFGYVRRSCCMCVDVYIFQKL